MSINRTGYDTSRDFDPEMVAYPHISHFGALKTSSVIPVIKGNFPGTSLDTGQWILIDENSASATVERGVVDLKCGTNSAGSVIMESARVGRFEAGQVTTYQSGVYAGTGQADNIRRWGVMDLERNNGLFFEWNGTTFRVVARAGGTDTAVASSAFNGEAGWEPSASNNTYRIFYSAGRAIFCRAQAGNIVRLHTMTDGDYPLVETLDLRLYYENTNSGNTTDKTLRVRGASLSVFGDLRFFSPNGAQSVISATEIEAMGLVQGFAVDTKFGRNPDVDTGSTPEDVWNGGSTYTGFNATSNEELDIVSADANDSGTDVSTGTATGGSLTTLVDSGATFVTDGVAVGDCLVNESRGTHGIISAVTETEVTVYRMDSTLPAVNRVGDSYRVVTAASTGCGLIQISGILDEDYVPQTPVYVTLNGTTTVTTSGVNAIRASRVKCIIAGSSGLNEGQITINQATTHANVFAVVPTTGQSAIACWTIPSGQRGLIKRIRVSIVRANGSAGSATIILFARNRGEAWQSKRVFEVQTGAPVEYTSVGGDLVETQTDLKFTVTDVSDNNTVVEAAAEYKLIDAEGTLY